MGESTRERFHEIAKFRRRGELFMMSMFNTVFWLGQTECWREEGAPKDIVEPHIGSYGPTLNKNRILCLDRMEMMVEVHSGLGYSELVESGEPSPYASIVPIIPLFEPKVLAEDERTITLKTAAGEIRRFLKTEGYGGECRSI